MLKLVPYFQTCQMEKKRKKKKRKEKKRKEAESLVVYNKIS